jgi:hypothetical protein
MVEEDWYEFYEVEADGIHARCIFNYKDAVYKMIVSRGDVVKEESWQASWPDPRFGMDVTDANIANQLAEKLAVEIEEGR